MNFVANLMAFNCFSGSSFSFNNPMLNCCTAPQDTNKITLIKLPASVDHSKIINESTINGFSIVFSMDKKVISVDTVKDYNSLLEIKLSKIKGLDISEISRLKGVNLPILKIFEQIIDHCIANEKTAGIIFDKFNTQYIISSYPVKTDLTMCAVYVSKCVYHDGFFDENLFN